MTQKTNLKKLSVTSILCALAYVSIFFFRFDVSVLTFDFKDCILAVISFLYGPIYAMISSILVAFLELISVSSTGWYGFVMNALSSVTFTTTCGLIYKYRRTLFGAIIGSVTAVFATTAVMLVANVLISPGYFGLPTGKVAAMIPSLFLPFNLIKGVVNSAITMIIYKPITSALKKMRLSVSDTPNTDIKKFIPLSICALVLLVIAVLVILFVLHGEFKIMG